MAERHMTRMPFGATLDTLEMAERAERATHGLMDLLAEGPRKPLVTLANAVDWLAGAMEEANMGHGGVFRDGTLLLGGSASRLVPTPTGAIDLADWGLAARFHWGYMMRAMASVTLSPYLATIYSTAGTASGGKPGQEREMEQRVEDAKAGLLPDVGVVVHVQVFDDHQAVEIYGRIESVDPSDPRGPLRLVWVRDDEHDLVVREIEWPTPGGAPNLGELPHLRYDYLRELDILMAALPDSMHTGPFVEMASDLGWTLNAENVQRAMVMVRDGAQAISDHRRGKGSGVSVAARTAMEAALHGEMAP